MRRRPPRSTRTDTLFPYTTLFRSCCRGGDVDAVDPVDLRPAEPEVRRRHRRRRAGQDHRDTEHEHDALSPGAPAPTGWSDRGHRGATLPATNPRLTVTPGPRADRKSTRLNSSH